MINNQLIVYKNISQDDVVLKCLSFMDDDASIDESEFIASLLVLAEKYELHGQLFQSLLTYLLAYHENTFTLALERKKDISVSLKKVVCHDFEIIYNLYHYDFSYLDSLYKDLFFDFQNSSTIINQEIFDVLTNLQTQLSQSTSVEEFYQILYNHYYQYGVGKYGLNKAFRYLNNQIIPIDHIGNNTLEQLIGYESQKERLIANTEAFLNGQKANNVLLYGDSGTGKSSSIKALLNRYYKQGLRMVEVYKHQFISLPQIINELQNRNYRFIIFMDDLSFEEFEVEYKYLKAVIEGGLEKKPDNILIYATSNRRHLVKQTWGDRQDQDEVNVNDAKQEKTSLSSRFGVKILFMHPDRQNYLDIVDGLAEQYGLMMERNELHQKALTWEIRHGGFSGRTAKQFINAMLGK